MTQCQIEYTYGGVYILTWTGVGGDRYIITEGTFEECAEMYELWLPGVSVDV